jgi:hypothetical protein
MAAPEPAPTESCGHPPRGSTEQGLMERSDPELLRAMWRHWGPPHEEVGFGAGAHMLTQSGGRRFKPVLRSTCAS